MKPTLGLVVDATVWDAGARVREVVLEITGDALDLGVVSTWTHTLDACGEEAATETFDRVLKPERACERRPYPGSAKILRNVQKERRIRVHRITRDHDLATISHTSSPDSESTSARG